MAFIVYRNFQRSALVECGILWIVLWDDDLVPGIFWTICCHISCYHSMARLFSVWFVEHSFVQHREFLGCLLSWPRYTLIFVCVCVVANILCVTVRVFNIHALYPECSDDH